MSTYQTFIQAVDGFGLWYSAQLVRRGVPAEGTVIAFHQSDSGCSSSYAFIVSGHEETGGLSDCSRAIGSSVGVLYLPENPRIRTTIGALGQLREDLEFLAVVGLLVPTLFFWTWHIST